MSHILIDPLDICHVICMREKGDSMCSLFSSHRKYLLKEPAMSSSCHLFLILGFSWKFPLQLSFVHFFCICALYASLNLNHYLLLHRA